MYSCCWTPTKDCRVKHFWVSMLKEFTVLLMLTHSLVILCRCQIVKDCIPVVEQANSVIHSTLDDPDIPLSSNKLRWLGCNVYNLGCVISERLLYWRSSSVSYCLWRAESMVLCWQNWWGNSYKDCAGNMAITLESFLTYCVAWNVCGSLRLLCFVGTNNATVCVPYSVCKTSITGYFSLPFDYTNIWDDWLFWWSIGRI